DLSPRFRNKFEKSTRPSNLPSGGIRMSSTADDTIFPNAAPIMIPTAMSITLPRIANSLNSFSMLHLLLALRVQLQPGYLNAAESLTHNFLRVNNVKL